MTAAHPYYLQLASIVACYITLDLWGSKRSEDFLLKKLKQFLKAEKKSLAFIYEESE